ncbi:MAG: hypothetical protein ABSB59_40340, partial [Streptosporangiaceae bacterium]
MSRALGPRPPVASGNAALAWLLIATAWGLAGLAWLAWAAARPGTPTPLVAVTSGVLIAVLGVAAVVVWRVVARRTTRPGDPVAALSRDRSVRQLKQASVGQTALRLRPSLTATPVPCDIGLLLGRLRQPGGRGPDLFTSWEDTVLAFMGPRSGKTTSVRADLWAATAELRAASGSGLWVFDPQRITAAGQRWWWNPLAGMITVEAAHRLAGHFVLTVDDSTKRDIWGPAAQELLTSLLLAAATSRRTLRDVSRWLDDPGSPTPAGLTDAAMRAPRRHAERSGGRLDPPMV